MDVVSRSVVGWMVAHADQAALAERLLAATCANQQILPGTLTVQADRGRSMTSTPVAFLLADLGSPRPTPAPWLQRQPVLPEPGHDVDVPARRSRPVRLDPDARVFCQQFFGWYNPAHRHSGIAMMTPQAVHYGNADKLHQARAQVLAAADAAIPSASSAGRPHPTPCHRGVDHPPESTQEATQ